MTRQLTPKQVCENWEAIKYAVKEVNGYTFIGHEGEYFRGLLINLLKGDLQCWFILDENRILKNVMITKIHKDDGGLPHVLITCAYGFSPTTFDEKNEAKDKMVEFTKNRNAMSLSAIVVNPMAENVLKKVGMTEIAKILSVKVGG